MKELVAALTALRRLVWEESHRNLLWISGGRKVRHYLEEVAADRLVESTVAETGTDKS